MKKPFTKTKTSTLELYIIIITTLMSPVFLSSSYLTLLPFVISTTLINISAKDKNDSKKVIIQ